MKKLHIVESIKRYSYIRSKEVTDIDGFITEYTMYYDNEEDRYVFVFGDSDLYSPEDEDFDYECDTRKEADEWFDNYGGFEDSDDDFYESYVNEDYAVDKVDLKTKNKLINCMDALGYKLSGTSYDNGPIKFYKTGTYSIYNNWAEVKADIDYYIKNGVGREYSEEEQDYLPELLNDILYSNYDYKGLSNY